MHKSRQTAKQHLPLVRRPLSAAIRDSYAPPTTRHAVLSATALCLALGASPGLPTTFTVTNLNDAGPGSLRQAVLNANALPGADDINATTITGTIGLTSGQLEVTDSLTIVGPGADRLTIDAGLRSRIFSLTQGDLRIHDLTLTRGAAPPGEAGGAVQMVVPVPGQLVGPLDLTIANCAITDSQALVGGAIGLSGGIDDGSGVAIVPDSIHVQVQESILTGNTGEDGGVGSALAIDLYYFYPESEIEWLVEVEVTDTTIARNTGDGISLDTSLSGKAQLDATIQNSIIEGNVGNGVSANYTRYFADYPINVDINNSTISGNSATGILNGSYNTIYVLNSHINENRVGASNLNGSIIITNSTISRNTRAGLEGRGRSTYGHAGLTIENSQIIDNYVGIDLGISSYLHANDILLQDNQGSGLVANGAVQSETYITLANSTVSGNGDSGIQADYLASLDILNSTITGNMTADQGGGIRKINAYRDGFSVKLANTIVAGNEALLGDPDISGHFTTTYSLVGETGTAEIEEPIPGSNLFGVDPLLGPLQDNGGPTLTHALLPGSPAIDAGDPGFVPPPDYDQRGEGFDRVVNGRIDIGAYEVQDGMPWSAISAWLTRLDDVTGDGPPAIAASRSDGTSQVKALDGTLISEFGTVGVQIIAVEPVPDLAASPAPELATLTLDPATGANAVQLHDTLTGAALPSIAFDPAFEPKAMAVLDDVNGNGAADIAVLGVGRDNGNLRATIKDGFSGTFIKHIWFDPAFSPVELLPVADLNNNRSQELALLGYDPVGKRSKVELRDGRFGTWLGNVWFDEDRFEPLDTALVDDINADGIDEIAILGRNVDNGNAKAAIKDLKTGQWLNQVWFGDAPPARQLVVVPDFSGNGASEIGALQVDDTREQVRVAFRDSQTREWLGLVWANGAYAPADVAVLPDVNGNGSAELAVLGDVDGQLRTLIKDSATDAWIGVVDFAP